MAGRGGLPPNQVQVAEQTAQILELIRDGKTTRQIADILQISPTTVTKRKKSMNAVVELPPRNTELAAQQQKECYERRLRGQTPPKIAEEMHLSVWTVKNHIKHEISARVLPERAEYVQQTLDRIDIAIERIMGQIEDNKAVARNAEVLAKLMERQAKMLGYDAPTQMETTVTVETKPEVLDMIERARQQMHAREEALKSKALENILDAEIVDE